MQTAALGLILIATGLNLAAQKSTTTAGPIAAAGPVELRVDQLASPLGIDDPAPKFSWQLRDSAPGARQAAYEIQVATRASLLTAGHADLWSSGRVAQTASIEIPYAGPELKPTTRYYWRVKVWNAAGKPYKASAVSWWETGLLNQPNQKAWRGEWIGYETAEEAAERNAKAEWIVSSDAKTPLNAKISEQRFAYRATVTLAKPVRFAALYATAEDTASAWINGAEILKASPQVPWGRLPWKKYVRAEATGQLGEGANTIAIETVHYTDNPNDRPPMIATLVVEYADGSWTSFSSDTEWKTATHASVGWQAKNFDDAAWKPAQLWQSHSGKRSEDEANPWIPESVKALRHEFAVSAPVKSARLYATALGAYEIFLNGKRVGDQVLAPGWTDYRERAVYQSYDVTALLAQGKNAMSALLAPGWYSTSLEWFQQANNYGDTPPALRAQLRIEHTDGSVEWIATDKSWQARPSSILHSEIYNGEQQDARLEQRGWKSAGFAASGWSAAQTVEPAPVEVVAQDFPPIRVEKVLEAKSLTEPKPGVYVYDFGQNFSGVERVRVTGPAGTEVRLRFAEILNPDGTIYIENLRTAKATDYFILRGQGVEEFTPQFTFHGYRYAELTGLPQAPAKEAVAGVVLHTDAPFAAKLATGSAMVNQLWSNILWGQRSNFVGLPTDCPQRDERLGWTGDAEVFWRAASYNTDLAAFSRKFAADLRGTQIGSSYYGIFAPGVGRPYEGQAAGWSDSGVIVPWTSWLQSGDATVIEQNWAAMEKYLAGIEAANPDYLWQHELGNQYGDWLSPEGSTDQALIGTAYWAYDARLMRQMAHATGRAAEEEKYAQLFEKLRAAFEKRFVLADGFVASVNNKDKAGDTQTGYVLALHMNLLPDDLRAAAAQKLVAKIHSNHDLIGTGFLGTPYLLEELTKAGNAKLAYTLLLNTRYPSWGYMVEHGATTMWERWNGDQMIADPGMNSFNHYAYGAVADWIYRYAAGIDATTNDPGFHTVVLHPVFDARLGHVAFDYASVYGPIHSDWTVKGATAEWHVTIPANASGRLELSADEAARYKLGGLPLAASKLVKSGEKGFEIPAGSYSFTVNLE